MQVNGEAYLLINGWMNFLSLLLAACLARTGFSVKRAAFGSMLGAVYAVMAWKTGGVLLGFLAQCISALMMAALVFGKRGLRLFPFTVASGLFLSGVTDYLLRRALPPAEILLVNGCVVLGFLVLGRIGQNEGTKLRLRICYQGKNVDMPAFLDSGNTLLDGITGLPVIVIPLEKGKELAPSSIHSGDLSSMPPGFRLIRTRTVAGEKTLMCFRPDKALLISGKKRKALDAAVALSDFCESRAIMPESCWKANKKEGDYAGF